MLRGSRLLTGLLLGASFLYAAPFRFARVGENSGICEVQLAPGTGFAAAVRNTPLPQGARLQTSDGRLETELDDGSVLRLTGSSLAELSDYTSLSSGQRITLIALDRGVAYFTGRLHENDSLSIAVPGAQVTLAHQARLRFTIASSWTEIAVLEGRVRFATPNAELELREGQSARVPQMKSARFQLFREVPEMEADEWSRKRDVLHEASLSASHLPGVRFGAQDLDRFGSWLQTDDAGVVWKPKVLETWAPFQSGIWRWYDQLGYTWIAQEDWGWTPYHYGRWLQHSSLGWVWSPGNSGVFKPGEVYWMRAPGLALWGALAPGERWTAAGPAQQFAGLNTSVARFDPGQRQIDPADPVARPKDLLKSAQFTAALPSPPLIADRLNDANAPLESAPVTAISFSKAPAVYVPGASFEAKPIPPPPVIAESPHPQRTTVVEKPVYVEIPEELYIPVPVYTGFVILNPTITDGRDPAKKKKKTGQSGESGRD